MQDEDFAVKQDCLALMLEVECIKQFRFYVLKIVGINDYLQFLNYPNISLNIKYVGTIMQRRQTSC